MKTMLFVASVMAVTLAAGVALAQDTGDRP